MQIGIIGLPKAGKTTVFNAVTKANVSPSSYSSKPNISVAKVPDSRLDTLAQMYKPRRVTPAEVTYIDLPPVPEGFARGSGIGGEYLNALQAADALMVVIRGFQNDSVPHIEETIDPFRDLENMLLEICFADLIIVERRLGRLNDGLKGAKAREKDILKYEQELLLNVKASLDQGLALRGQQLASEDRKIIAGFGFLSVKPLIAVLNTDEEQLGSIERLEEKLESSISGDQIHSIILSAKLEMELAQMDPADEMELREGLVVGEPSLQRMITLSYQAVDQVCFFTVGEDEVRAWEISRNTSAQKAAGKIHSDLERGFIRAEVISYENLVDCGGLIEGRKRGVLRQEGKDYTVKDGEIMHVLFNI